MTAQDLGYIVDHTDVLNGDTLLYQDHYEGEIIFYSSSKPSEILKSGPSVGVWHIKPKKA